MKMALGANQWGRMIDMRLLYRPILWKIMKRGMIVTSPGIIIVDRNSMNTKFLPLKSTFAKA